MSRKTLVADALFYGTLDIVNRSIYIVLVPLYTRLISQANYGNLDLILTAVSFVAVFVDLQLIHGFSRFYPQYLKENKGEIFVGTNIITRLALSALVVAAVVAAGLLGAIEFDFAPSFTRWRDVWIIALAGVPLGMVLDLLLLQARMLRDKKIFAVGSVLSTFFTGLLCVALVAFFKLDIMGVVLGQTAGKILALAFMSLALRSRLKLSFDRAAFFEVMKFVLPIIPGWWTSFASTYINRFFIYGEIGALQVAVLAICAKVSHATGMLANSFRLAWQPLAMQYIGDEKSDQFYRQSMRMFLAASIMIIFAATGFAKLIIAVLAPGSYAEAAKYVTFFVIAMVVGDVEYNLQIGNQIAKKTSWFSIAAAAGLTINVCCLLLLVRPFGIAAAAAGALASVTVRALIAYFSSQRNHYVNYDNKAFAVFAAACALACALSFARPLVSNALFMTVVPAVGCAIGWLMLTREERRTAVGMLKSRLEKFSRGRK